MDWMNEIGIIGGIAGFWSSVVSIILGHFIEIDYLSNVLKKLFLEEVSDKEFYRKYLNDEEAPRRIKKHNSMFFNCCYRFCIWEHQIDENSLEKYKKTRVEENKKCYDSLEDGDVDRSDIMCVVFDIFSRRRRFNFDLENRIALYCGFVARMCKFLRCKSSSIDHMNHINDMFEKAKGRMENDCDIIEVMDQIRRSKNFQRNFLSRRQKILLKFDKSNIIYQDHD